MTSRSRSFREQSHINIREWEVKRGAVSKYKVNPFTCKKFIADVKYFDRMTIKVNVIQSPRLFKEALPKRVLFPNLKYIY